MMGEPPETAYLSSWELTDSGLTARKIGIDLGPLHMCDSCVAWSVCWAPSSKIMTCPWHLSWLLGTYSPGWGCLARP